MSNRELLAAKICKATQKTNFSCNKNEKCQGTWQCAYCLVMAEELLANDVVAPPCKVGDIVYAVSYSTNTYTYEMHRGYISCIDIRAEGEYIIIRHDGLVDEPYFDKIIGRFDDFGKLVFRTKKEAEEKLEEIKHG